MGEPAGFIRSPLVEDLKTRFFVITSNVGENVVKSVEHNVWATQRKNEQRFDEAYQSCPQIILVFSVTKSNAFQGYARMRSHTGRSTSRHDPFRGFGRLFDVEWLRLEDIEFQEVQHLRNPFNENKQIAYSRDGQELPHSVGSQLCRLIDLKVYREDPDNYEPVGLELRPLRSESPPRSAPMLALPAPSQPQPQHLPQSSIVDPRGHFGPSGSAPPAPGYHFGAYGQPPPQFTPHGHPERPIHHHGYPGAPSAHGSGYPGAPPPGYPGAPLPTSWIGAHPPAGHIAPPGYSAAPPGAAPPPLGTAPPPGYPGAPPGTAAPPGYPGAPPGSAPPPGYPYYPPWMYGRRRKKRRRRSSSSSSSSEGGQPKKPKKKKKDGAKDKKKRKKRNREEKPDFKNMNYEEYMAWWQRSRQPGAGPPPGQPAQAPPPNGAPPARPPPPGAQQESPRSLQIPASWHAAEDARQLAHPPLSLQAAAPVASQAQQHSRSEVPAPEQTPERVHQPDQAAQRLTPTGAESAVQPAPASPGSASSYSVGSEEEAAVLALESEVNKLVQQADEEAAIADVPQNPSLVDSSKAVQEAPTPTETLSIGQKLASFASTFPKLKKTLPSPLTAKLPRQEDRNHAEDPRQQATLAEADKKVSSTLPADSQKKSAAIDAQPAKLVGFVPPTSPCSSSEGGDKNGQAKPGVQQVSKAGDEAKKLQSAPSSPSSQGSEVDTAWARALSSRLDDASGESDAEASGPVLTDAYS